MNPEENPELLSGSQRAAIFLMALGEDVAAIVMRDLDPKEVQKVGHAMARMKNVNRPMLEEVMNDFVGQIEKETSLGVGSSEYVRKVLVKALGQEKADTVIDKILLGGGTKGLEAMKWLDPRTIAEIIRMEHPQIIAIVLSYLEPEQASQVLLELPERGRHDIIMRIATMEGVQPAALKELDEVLERQFLGSQNLKSSSVGGLKQAAEILNFMDSSIEGSILEGIEQVDGELKERIQDLMFVFENLIEVDDRSMQVLLREISGELLVLALKGADEKIKEKFLKNMSKRAAEMLVDDMASKGPVKVSEVETAQKEILSIAKRLSDEGQIQLAGKGEDYV
jgi:flagellar motor switch protein FliG